MTPEDFDVTDEGQRHEGEPTVFRTRHAWRDGDEISSTIIDAVAATVGKEPTKLPSLYDVIDPDALDQLLRSVHAADIGGETAQVDFEFHDCRVSVRSDGAVWIEHPD